MYLVKMRSYGSRVDPYSNITSVLIKRGNLDTDMHTKRRHVKMKAKIGVLQQKPKNTNDCQQTTRS